MSFVFCHRVGFRITSWTAMGRTGFSRVSPWEESKLDTPRLERRREEVFNRAQSNAEQLSVCASLLDFNQGCKTQADIEFEMNQITKLPIRFGSDSFMGSGAGAGVDASPSLMKV